MIMYCPELNYLAVILVSVDVFFQETRTVHKWYEDGFAMTRELFDNYHWVYVGDL